MIEWIRTKYIDFIFWPVFISFWMQWMQNMLVSGYFYKFYKHAMKEAYSESILVYEIFQNCSWRIDVFKQIKSEKIIILKIEKSSKTSH